METAEVTKVKTIKMPLKFKFNIFNKIINKIKILKEELYMDNDLLFILTYMASLSTAQLSRDKIFEMAASKEEYAPSKYFKKVINLTKNWHYDYATACELVAEKVKHDRVKRLFNRLANAIAAGEPDREVLENEWKVFKTVRKDEYLRSLESLRKWTDAYVSILVSASLISIVILLSVMIYKSGDPVLILSISALFSLLFSLFGVFMLFKSAPKDVKTHNLNIKSKEQRLISKLSPLLLPIAVISLIVLTVIPTILNLDFEYGSMDLKGLGFVICGMVLLPLGILGRRDYIKISKRDEAFTGFIRSLGAIISGAGVSIAEALSRIDQKNLGELKDLAMQLYRRLSFGLDPKLCWERFIGESGSYLIHKLTNIFIDAADMGGDTDTIGEIVSSSNLEMVLLRLKRELISNGFVNLVIPLHAAMVGLLIFIVKILSKFMTLISTMFATQMAGIGSATDVLGKLSSISGLNMGIFGGIPSQLLNIYLLAVVLILTFTNTLACKVVKGGANYLLYYYGSILSITSGVLMILLPKIINWAFSIPTLIGGG